MKDKTILWLIYLILVLTNLKYLLYVVQIPYTLIFTDYWRHGSFGAFTDVMKNNSEELKKENIVGFISDIPNSRVLDEPASIKNFYITQFAIVPAVLHNDINQPYVVGIFDRDTMVPNILKIEKRLHPQIFVFKREIK